MGFPFWSRLRTTVNSTSGSGDRRIRLHIPGQKTALHGILFTEYRWLLSLAGSGLLYYVQVQRRSLQEIDYYHH